MESWMLVILCCFFFFSSRRRHTRFDCDWSSDVCSSDLAQRLNNVVRAAEQARECEEQRKKSQFSKAVDAARKALAIEPNLPAAHICIATVYEAQHMPLDSLLAAYQRAAKGDSLNATAWENIAHVYQQKGDTLKAIDALTHELAGGPPNTPPPRAVAGAARPPEQSQRGHANPRHRAPQTTPQQ